jgi:hypothetical protein
MTVQIHETNETSQPCIQIHPAWQGKIAGLEAEDRLKGQAPFVYLLREGEYPSHYYVSFVLPDHTIKHQPFLIRITPQGWYCRNGSGIGPCLNKTIEDVIDKIMHCRPDECTPLQRR